jgi:hypothetical protein
MQAMIERADPAGEAVCVTRCDLRWPAIILPSAIPLACNPVMVCVQAVRITWTLRLKESLRVGLGAKVGAISIHHYPGSAHIIEGGERGEQSEQEERMPLAQRKFGAAVGSRHAKTLLRLHYQDLCRRDVVGALNFG